MDSKVVIECIYGCTLGVSDFKSIINDCRRLISSDLATFDVRFIRRQASEVVHSVAKVTQCHVNFRIFISVLSCISTLILNEMH